jgi:PTH2 family peptidyl-tRNA hydrolase
LSSQEFKQVIVVRTDIRMGKGKLAVQVAHAAVEGASIARNRDRAWHDRWKSEGQAKVAVKASSLDDLYELRRSAEKLGLPTAIIEDRGLTQLEPGTTTCLAIGPGPSKLIDKVTGKLKLL